MVAMRRGGGAGSTGLLGFHFGGDNFLYGGTLMVGQFAYDALCILLERDIMATMAMSTPRARDGCWCIAFVISSVFTAWYC